MRQEVVEYLPWGLSALSLAMAYMTGNKWRMVWLFGLFIQCLWLTWVFASGLWGFLPLTASLFVVYFRNHLKWERERLAAEVRALLTAETIKDDGVFRSYPESVRPYRRKELYKDGKLIATVDMAIASSAANSQVPRAKSPGETSMADLLKVQEDRRKPTPWWHKDPWAPDPLQDYMIEEPGTTFFCPGPLTDKERANLAEVAKSFNPLQAPPIIILNKHGHEPHCSLMFPATLGTEDDRCDCIVSRSKP